MKGRSFDLSIRNYIKFRMFFRKSFLSDIFIPGGNVFFLLSRKVKRGRIILMEKTDLINYLQKINTELYQFSYALVPDDLQAQQIIVDSIELLINDAKDNDSNIFFKLLESSKNEEKARLLFSLRIHLYKYIFKIGRRRFGQLKNSLRPSQDFGSFYSVGPTEKAALFLKHKTKFQLIDMENILELSRHEIISYLHNGRESLLQSLGKSCSNY